MHFPPPLDQKYPFERGTCVRALKTITEGGDNSPPDLSADYPEPGYIHALKGEIGYVVSVDPIYNEKHKFIPTVRFKRTGTATIVGEDEVEGIG